MDPIYSKLISLISPEIIALITNDRIPGFLRAKEPRGSDAEKLPKVHHYELIDKAELNAVLRLSGVFNEPFTITNITDRGKASF